MKRALPLILVGVIALMSGAVHAAPSPGLTVSPAIEQVSINQNQTTASFPVTLTNGTGADITISVDVADFTAQGEGGGIRFLSSSESAVNTHGLVAALADNQQLATIGNGQTKTVTMYLTHLDSLAAGGHYAALVYRIINENGDSSNSVNLRSAVSTLVFVTTEGKGTQDVRLSTTAISPVQPSLPSSLDVVFSNTGNTQTTLHGVAQLVAPDGRIAAQGLVNADSGLILPGSKRLFSVQLAAQTAGMMWPGVYHLKILYRHEGQADYMAYDKSFVYLNIWLLLVTLVALAFVIFAVWRLVRRFRRKQPKRVIH